MQAKTEQEETHLLVNRLCPQQSDEGERCQIEGDGQHVQDETPGLVVLLILERHWDVRAGLENSVDANDQVEGLADCEAWGLFVGEVY